MILRELLMLVEREQISLIYCDLTRDSDSFASLYIVIDGQAGMMLAESLKADDELHQKTLIQSLTYHYDTKGHVRQRNQWPRRF